MALAMDTGRVLWIRQTLAGDAWNVGCFETGPGRVNCPEKAGPDFDFGSSPAIATLPGGQRVLVAGQKSGALSGINPDTGEQCGRHRLAPAEFSAALNGDLPSRVRRHMRRYQRARETARTSRGARRRECRRWQTGLDCSPDARHLREAARCNTGQPAAVSSIPGVVLSGSLDGHLRGTTASPGQCSGTPTPSTNTTR